jgi:hypothetical protein
LNWDTGSVTAVHARGHWHRRLVWRTTLRGASRSGRLRARGGCSDEEQCFSNPVICGRRGKCGQGAFRSCRKASAASPTRFTRAHCPAGSNAVSRKPLVARCALCAERYEFMPTAIKNDRWHESSSARRRPPTRRAIPTVRIPAVLMEKGRDNPRLVGAAAIDILDQLRAELANDSLAGHQVEMPTTGILEKRNIARANPSQYASGRKVV